MSNFNPVTVMSLDEDLLKRQWVMDNKPKYVRGESFFCWVIFDNPELAYDVVAYRHTNFRYEYLCINKQSGLTKMFDEETIDKIREIEQISKKDE